MEESWKRGIYVTLEQTRQDVDDKKPRIERNVFNSQSGKPLDMFQLLRWRLEVAHKAFLGKPNTKSNKHILKPCRTPLQEQLALTIMIIMKMRALQRKCQSCEMVNHPSTISKLASFFL